MHLLLVDVWSFLLSEYACVVGYIEKWNVFITEPPLEIGCWITLHCSSSSLQSRIYVARGLREGLFDNFK
jgi:hypothetical protein